MKKIYIILFLLCSAFMTSFAQELDEALRYIKVGNTYREVDEYNLSESFLFRAINIITTKYPNQKYWEASAYENLGLLYRDHDDPVNSIKYFNKALDIYQKSNYQASVKALKKMLSSVDNNPEYFAGLDVGATGVKLSLMGVKLNPVTKKLVITTERKFKNANVNMGVKNVNAYKEGAAAINSFIRDSLSKYNVPAEHIIIALSSGLVSRIQADTAILKDEIRTALGDPLKKIDVVDYIKEGELTIRGAIPQRYWYDCAVVDIGSGNTKGGYYQKPARPGDTPKMMGIEFPGTKAYATSIEKKYDPKNLQEYITAIDAESKDLSLQIRREFDERRPEMKRRRRVYLLGGASYVANILTKPDSVKRTIMSMSQLEALTFKRNAVTDINQLRNPDLSRIADPAIRDMANSKISEINNVIFPRDEDLISAANLVYDFVYECTRSSNVKEVIFLQGTENAWISGLVRQTIEQQYGKGN